MNWTRIILDGIIMAAYFNIFACFIVAMNPRIMMGSYPKGIREAAPKPQTKREKRIYHSWMYFAILIPLMIYGTASAINTGVEGFWNLFWSAYVEWNIISISDFFILDMIMLVGMKERMMVPGTEGHEDYKLKNWVTKLAIPEHFLGWPLIMAPLLSLIQAGFGSLI